MWGVVVVVVIVVIVVVVVVLVMVVATIDEKPVVILVIDWRHLSAANYESKKKASFPIIFQELLVVGGSITVDGRKSCTTRALQHLVT